VDRRRCPQTPTPTTVVVVDEGDHCAVGEDGHDQAGQPGCGVLGLVVAQQVIGDVAEELGAAGGATARGLE